MASPLVTVGDHYSRSRLRLTELSATIDAEGWERPVVACPGWRVRDVVGHLFGNTEDAMAGRLSSPPSPDQTAEQVARHADDDPLELLRAWNEIAASFEDVITQLELWPAAVDALSHEHDMVADGETLLGPPPGDAPLTLDTTAFEILRFRLGRRTRGQVEALAWSGDPTPVLDKLFVFGPATHAITE